MMFVRISYYFLGNISLVFIFYDMCCTNQPPPNQNKVPPPPPSGPRLDNDLIGYAIT